MPATHRTTTKRSAAAKKTAHVRSTKDRAAKLPPMPEQTEIEATPKGKKEKVVH